MTQMHGATSAFEQDTACSRVSEGWAAEVSSRWSIGTRPNGGYLMALAARAMLGESARADPLTLTAHYLVPPSPGPALLRTEVVKAGRTLATVRAQLCQGGKDHLELLGAFGDLGAQRGPTRRCAPAPQIPGPDQCVPLAVLTGSGGGPLLAFMQRFDIRIPPETTWGGAGGEEMVITGWIRFSDGAEPSVLSLLCFVDSFPPALMGSIHTGWVPTLELTVHVRGRPVPGWVLGRFSTRLLVDGLFEEDGELWDADGRLVAMSRQLALILQPRVTMR